MVAKVQIKRTEGPNQAPLGLSPGELVIEMNEPCRLWVGVPFTLHPDGRKLLFDSSKIYLTQAEGDGRYVNVTGDYMSGALNIGVKGNNFGTPAGTPFNGAVVAADANFTLYNYDPGNWCGMGTDPSGNWWLRTGNAGSPTPALRVDTVQNVFLHHDPAGPMHAATKQYVDNMVAGVPVPPLGNYVLKTGDTMSGALQINSNLGVAGGISTGTLTASGNISGNVIYANNIQDSGPLGVGGPVTFASGFNSTSFTIGSWIAGGLNISGLTETTTINNSGNVNIGGAMLSSYAEITKWSGGPHYRSIGWSDPLGGQAYICPSEGDPNYGNDKHISLFFIHSIGVSVTCRIDVVSQAVYDFRHDGMAFKLGGGMWANGSDGRIKNVLGNYTSGLAAVRALQPVRYTYRGNDSQGAPAMFALGREHSPVPTGVPAAPYLNSIHHHAAVEAREFIGLVAQDAEVTMPELVKAEKGHIDGQEVADMRQLDPSPILYALINAVKELAAKVEALESA